MGMAWVANDIKGLTAYSHNSYYGKYRTLLSIYNRLGSHYSAADGGPPRNGSVRRYMRVTHTPVSVAPDGP